MKHFTITELTKSSTAEKLGIKNIPDSTAINNLENLVRNVLDPLREAFGKPITVNSGYRCRQLNRAVGGVANSQHIKGEAAYITAGNKNGNKQLYKLLKSLNLPVDQAINEQNFSWIHVSHRYGHNRNQFL